MYRLARVRESVQGGQLVGREKVTMRNRALQLFDICQPAVRFDCFPVEVFPPTLASPGSLFNGRTGTFAVFAFTQVRCPTRVSEASSCWIPPARGHLSCFCQPGSWLPWVLKVWDSAWECVTWLLFLLRVTECCIF